MIKFEVGESSKEMSIFSIFELKPSNQCSDNGLTYIIYIWYSKPPSILTSVATDEPQLASSSCVAQETPSNILHNHLNNVAQVAPTSARTKRLDNLDELL
jgi:hypothetical protein